MGNSGTTNPKCAGCGGTFKWMELYRAYCTPGSEHLHPYGSINRHRYYCPHCGDLILDQPHTKEKREFKHIWVGENKRLNEGCELPSYEDLSYRLGITIPDEHCPSFHEAKLNISIMKELDQHKQKQKAKQKTEKVAQEISNSKIKELEAQGDVNGIIAFLKKDRTSSKHEDAVKALTNIGSSAVATLIDAFKKAERTEKAMKDKDAHLRGGIIKTLGKIGDLRAIESIMLALDDNIPFVRIYAADALDDEIGIHHLIDPSVSNEIRKPEVIEALRWTAKNDPNPRISKVAQEALYQLLPPSGPRDTVLQGKQSLWVAPIRTLLRVAEDLQENIHGVHENEMITGTKMIKHDQDFLGCKIETNSRELYLTPDEAEKIFVKISNRISSVEITPDERYIALDNGIVVDTKTGLEWYAGPDEPTGWEDAERWIKSLTVSGGGWRMPTEQELETLWIYPDYDDPTEFNPDGTMVIKGAGKRNITPLLKTTGIHVWAPKSGKYFSSFDICRFEKRGGTSFYIYARGFAVRSRR